MQTNDTREIIYQSSENKNETQCIVTQGEDFNLPGVICFFQYVVSHCEDTTSNNRAQQDEKNKSLCKIYANSS